MKKIWALLIALCLVLGSFGAFAEEVDTKQLYQDKIAGMTEAFKAYYETTGETEKITPYEETITVRTVNSFSSSMQDAMSVFTDKYGETWDDTRWTDLFKSAFNVDVDYTWWVSDDQYNQKLRLDMTSGDLPDIFTVTSQTDLLQLVESEQIWDLTELYDIWASDMDKANWESDGGVQLSMGSIDGKLYGLPKGLSDTDLFSYIWIRDDWMQKLNLAYPTTIDELKAVMDAFMAADFDGNGEADTLGIGVDKDLYYSTRGLFAAYGAYPEFWDEQDGKLAWGGTTEETKTALGFLADLYAGGYLDPEFITKSNNDMLESVLSGKCGIVYGGHWLGHTWGDLRELDPEASMVAIPLPSADAAAPVEQYLQPNVLGWVVVNKEFEHPEIAFKLFAASDYAFSSTDSDWWIYDENTSWCFNPGFILCDSFENMNAWLDIQEVYKNGDESILSFNGIAYWGKLHGEAEYEWSLMFGNREEQEGIAMSILYDADANGQVKYEPFYGAQSTFMQDHWSTIKDEQLIAFTKIIIGEVGLEEGFASWLNTFENLGGAKITEEVNAWYAEQQG